MYARSAASRYSRKGHALSVFLHCWRRGREGSSGPHCCVVIIEGAIVGIFGQIGDGDHVAGKNGRALDDVLQLAYVAGPFALAQRAHHARVDLLLPQPVLFAEALHEGLGQQGNVIRAIPECRNADRKDIQAEEEIFPEAPGLNFFGQILVGRGQDADVDLDDVFRADPHDLAVL